MLRLRFSLSRLLYSLALVAVCSAFGSETQFLGSHDGKVVEFHGPDDLHLDPATNVIAVDAYGDRDRVVNGITFLSDGRKEGVGMATNAGTGVSVTTTAANVIDNWAAAPAFTGRDSESASNLAAIMRDVRYEDAPGPVEIDVEGLTPRARYEVQVLFNEGEDNFRQFDIAVDGELVVDNLTSEGLAPCPDGTGGQRWSPSNSFAYVGTFRATSAGELQIVLQHDLGGASMTGTDLNVGFQGVIVHVIPPKDLPIVELAESGGDLVFRWVSQAGKLYNLRSETDPAAADRLEWPAVDGAVAVVATPPENTLTIPRPEEPFRLYVIEEYDAPPVAIFSEDFESGAGEWSRGVDGEGGTEWELGSPTNVGPGDARSGDNCFGTNLAGNYGLNADTWLRSPEIDLTAGGGATLEFYQFVDIEEGFDVGQLSILNAADDTVLAVLDGSIDGATPDWAQFRRTIPAEAVGKVIKLEFRMRSDEVSSFAGWYVDDIEVTVP